MGGITPTAEQQAYANAKVSSPHYSQAALVSTQPFLSMLGNTDIYFSLPGSNEIYQATKANNPGQTSPYYDEIWMGNLKNGHLGNVMFIRKDSLLAGFIHTEDSYYSIVPVGNDIAYLLKHEVESYDDYVCGNENDVNGGDGINPNQCVEDPLGCNTVVDVAVLMSDPDIAFLQAIPGASSNPFIPILYTLIGLESANFALINSEVDNFYFRFNLERFFFVFTTNASLVLDLENLADAPETEIVRNELGADLVVMLTNQMYTGVFGSAWEIGPAEDDAYAIVEIASMINPRWTFAHELAHLVGARHNRTSNGGNDDTDICSHALTFAGGDLGIKRTVLSLMIGTPPLPPGSGVFDFVPGGRLLHFSNPDVEVDGGDTGTPDDNNALTLINNACEVAFFRGDPQLHIDLLTPEEVCMQDLMMASVLIFEPNASFPGTPLYSVS